MNSIAQHIDKNFLAAQDVDEKVTISAVPAEMLDQIWDTVSGFLSPAVDRSHGRWSMPSLKEAVREGKQQLWIVYQGNNPIKGVATTEIQDYPNKRMLAIQYLGGEDLDKWAFSMLEILEEFATATNCKGIEATARKGFWKWMKDYNYEEAYTVFQKEISSE